MNLGECFSGEVITKEDKGYEEARQIWNRAIQKFPLAIAYCNNVKDVACAVDYAVSHRLKIRVRSGGHNYEGYCIGDNVFVIDVSRMKDIEINYKENTVKISAGVQNGENYDFLGNLGYPFPGGTCPTVGIIPYALGGGWGLSARLFGLGIDNVVQIEMVDYNGFIVKADKIKNKDLFWALRGSGGGNFGVITSMKFNLPPKFNKVTLFTLNYPNSNQIEQADIMEVFGKEYETLDRRVNMKASFFNSKDNGIGVYIYGLFYGEEDELKEILKEFLKFKNVVPEFKYTSFLEAIKIVEGNYPESEKFKDTGVYVNRLFLKEELLKLSGFLKFRPFGSIQVSINFYGLGGAVKDKNRCETAFFYRDANYILGIQTVFEDDKFKEGNIKWVQNKLQYIKTITNGFYVNFPDGELCNYEKEYYGKNKCPLRYIKDKYDPFNIFNYPQSIK